MTNKKKKSQSASRFALIVPPVPLKSRFEAAYVVSVTLFRVLRAPSAREAGFFFMD